MLKIKDEVNLKELEKFGIKRYGQYYNAITKFSIPYFLCRSLAIAKK